MSVLRELLGFLGDDVAQLWSHTDAEFTAYTADLVGFPGEPES